MENNQFKKIVERVEALEKRVNLLESKGSVPTPHKLQDNFSDKKYSLKEFLLTKKLSDDVKKVLAIGYFLERNEGMTSFNAGDLMAAIERAKEKKPSNINDKVNMNIKKGHMEEATEKKGKFKSWYLTNSGELFVENNFSEK